MPFAPSSESSNVPFISSQDIIDILGRGGTADPGLLIAADAACDICRTVAEQSFTNTIGTITLDGTGTDSLLLPELPVNSVGTVVLNGATLTDYVLNNNGILFRGTAGFGTWPAGRQNVTVTYNHGYTDVPRDVRAVALAIAQRMVFQGPALQETIGNVTIRYGVNNTDLTAGEERILAKYRQHR